MINRLRRKFVLINMATVGVVLLIGLAALMGFTVNRQRIAAEAALSAALTSCRRRIFIHGRRVSAVLFDRSDALGKSAQLAVFVFK